MAKQGMGRMIRKYRSSDIWRNEKEAQKKAGGVDCRACQCVVWPVNGTLPEKCERCGAPTKDPAPER